MNILTKPLIFTQDGAEYCWLRESHPVAPNRQLPPSDYVHSSKTNIRQRFERLKQTGKGEKL